MHQITKYNKEREKDTMLILTRLSSKTFLLKFLILIVFGSSTWKSQMC